MMLVPNLELPHEATKSTNLSSTEEAEASIVECLSHVGCELVTHEEIEALGV